MSIYLNLIENNPNCPELDLCGDDEYGDELALFLEKGVNGVNGFNKRYLSQYVFNSSGHPRWDFTFKDERDYNDKDWDGLVSLNLAWDCWISARGI